MQNKCESNTEVISSGILFIDVVAKYYTVYNRERAKWDFGYAEKLTAGGS